MYFNWTLMGNLLFLTVNNNVEFLYQDALKTFLNDKILLHETDKESQRSTSVIVMF